MKKTVVVTASQNQVPESPQLAKPGALVLNRFPFAGTVYSQSALEMIENHFDVRVKDRSGAELKDGFETYESADVLFGTWGLPPLDPPILERLPNLRIVFHAAGAWETLYTEEAQARGIVFCNTVDLNSEYVARHTSASIILALKGFFTARESLRSGRSWDESASLARGCYGASVGLAGFGRIGRKVAEYLGKEGISVRAFDPGIPKDLMSECGALPAKNLEELFSDCQVVSLHLPGIPETERMISRRLLDRLPHGAALINTSRGSVIDEEALMETLRSRPDVTAILDVCASEPAHPESPLLAQSNCFLTPHISGAIGREREHLGDVMVEEALRWLRGDPLRWVVSPEPMAVTHTP